MYNVAFILLTMMLRGIPQLSAAFENTGNYKLFLQSLGKFISWKTREDAFSKLVIRELLKGFYS